jgi:hypothetical protein
MSNKRRVPEDLMGTILGEGSGAFGEEGDSSWSTGLRSADRRTDVSASDNESTISWEEQPERVGTTFNLSKQVGGELDKLRLELQQEEGIRSSNSEIAEVALRIAVEDARERGMQSELVKRLSGQPADREEEDTGAASGTLDESTDEGSWTTRRSVDNSGHIYETVYNADGEITDEAVVGNVADLPVEAEYLDEEGRFRSLGTDELGNTFELLLDNEFNTLGARLVRGAD